SKRIGPGASRLHEDFLSRPWLEQELLLRYQPGKTMTVAGHLGEAVSIERERVVQVRSNIPDAPQLRFARAQRDRGIEHPVHRAHGVVADPAMHDLPVPDLGVLEQQYVLGQTAQLRKRVEQALDDQRTGHAV